MNTPEQNGHELLRNDVQTRNLVKLLHLIVIVFLFFFFFLLISQIKYGETGSNRKTFCNLNVDWSVWGGKKEGIASVRL